MRLTSVRDAYPTCTSLNAKHRPRRCFRCGVNPGSTWVGSFEFVAAQVLHIAPDANGAIRVAGWLAQAGYRLLPALLQWLRGRVGGVHGQCFREAALLE